jgi:hypothetical protein
MQENASKSKPSHMENYVKRELKLLKTSTNGMKELNFTRKRELKRDEILLRKSPTLNRFFSTH